jgi:hypothetical protein
MSGWIAWLIGVLGVLAAFWEQIAPWFGLTP